MRPDIVEIARAHADRVDLSKIPSASAWNAERAAALGADEAISSEPALGASA